MPNPEFTKTVAELDQPYLLGPLTGPKYRQILTGKFNAAFNQLQIDQALSLGHYMVHSESNKQKRAGIRAVMLAKFLMSNHPTAQAETLRKSLAKLTLPQLKQSFIMAFPALQDNGNRGYWDAPNFTDPNTLATMKKCRSGTGPHTPLPQFRFIVHGVANIAGDVFDKPDILTRYEVLSMSLVGNGNSHVHPSAPQGVILRVPKNNILAAAVKDVAVHNYAPGFNPQAPAAVTITDNLMEIAIKFDGLQTPDFLLQNPRGMPYYNEVVVCGRAGVPLPHGVTEQMRVVGVFVATDQNGNIRGDVTTRREREMRAKACAVNYHLPLIYLPSIASSAALP